MYKISVPISIANPRFESYYDEYIKLLHEADVQRVFLVAVTWTAPECDKQRVAALLEKYVPMFRAEGFEVGVWIDSLGHGGLIGEVVNADAGDGLQRMVSLEGHINMGAYCPLCEDLRALAADWIRRLGRTGAELIMLDDDYRYSLRAGEMFCACSSHRALFEKVLGEEFDPQRMKRALTEGGPNSWRDAWLKVQGESLTDFARMLREALDEENPQVRLSACAVLSTWDVDGVDSITLSRTFAGDTPPYLRLIGAPYWAALRSFGEVRLATVCEYERMQQQWCKNSGIEIFCEGDSYPRPRYKVPAAYLEGMDQVMHASGECDGMLKYMFDYVSSPHYDTGYLERHIENKPVYAALENAFAGKRPVGVNIFVPMKTFALSHKPGKKPDDRCIPAVLRFATDLNLPVRYDGGDGPTLIFGDAGELATETQLVHGAVLDITAAQALTRRGFDVGLSKVHGLFAPNSERYPVEDEVVGVSAGEWYDIEPAPGANTDSVLVRSVPGMADVERPAMYIYENAAGQRFAVYAFSAQESLEIGAGRGVFRSRCRAEQIRRVLVWLSDNAPEVMCVPEPDLYMLAKRDDDSLTVALWNFGADRITRPVVRFADEWNRMECHVGSASLEGNTVSVCQLDSFMCACFTVKL